MIYKMQLKDTSDEMTFYLLETPIVDKDIEGAVDNTTIDGDVYTDYLWLKKQYVQKWAIMCEDEYSRLRGFYTRQFDEGAVPSYRLYYGTDVFSNLTAEGKRINFTITGIEAPMALDTIKGDTEQTSYTGKNLAPYIAGTTTNAVNLSVDSRGVYKLGGTASADTTFSIALPSTLASGTYRTMSINIIDGSITGTSTLRYRIRDANGSYAGGPDIAEITVSSNSTGRLSKTIRNELKTLNIWVASGCNCTNFRFTIQLENGQTATDFEPYVGGQPSPSPSYPQNINVVTGQQTITITGKNLWGGFTSFTTTGATVNFTNNADGSVTASGTATSNTSSITNASTAVSNGWFVTLQSGSYVASAGTLPTGVLLQLFDASTGAGIGNAQGQFTLSEPTQIYARIRVASGTTVSGTFKIQIEHGNQATTYEAFRQQSQEINLGKNLFDKAHANILQAGITATKIESATANRTLWIPCEPNTTYTVQKRNDGDTNRFNVATTVLEPAIDVAITNRIEQPNAKSITYTTSATAKYLCVQYFRTAETVLTEQQVLDSIQIEKGYDATTYASYFTPIELCKIGTYQDKIYKSGDKWYLHKEVGKVVLDGSDGEGWTAQTSNNGYMYRATVSGVASNPADETSNLLSDFFTATSGQAIYSVTSGGFMAQLTVAGYIRFNIGDTTNKLADFKTWLGSNNTTVYYVLATATDTEITDATLLAQLNHAYSLYIGENNILSVTPSLMPEIKIAYTEIFEKSTDVVPETPVRLTLTDDGVINACGCRRNVQLTMRETA